MKARWRIVQTRADRFGIQRRSWFFWIEVDHEDSLEKAQATMERMILAVHTYPRVVDSVTDEVGFVRARLKGAR